MLSIATIWSVDPIQPGGPVPTPVQGPASGLIYEPTLRPTQRNAARRTGRLASTSRAITGSTVPSSLTASGRPQRFRTCFSVDLPRMSVV